MKIALLFPGQGSQYVGMGKNLYENFAPARQIFDQANEVMGYDIKKKIFEGTEAELKQTALTQPAIFIVSCAAFKVFSSLIPHPSSPVSFVAGHSLGEYSALFAAQVFDFQTGLKLVKYRSRFIQEACERFPGSMAAVIGMGEEDLRKISMEIAQRYGCCELVNFNAPGQIVVAGNLSAISKLIHRVSEVPNSRAISLNVSGAFHSSLMKEAARKMAEVLSEAALEDATLPVVTNVDAQVTSDREEFRKKLAMQIDHPVLWEESIRKMISEGVELFIEVGPGKVLSGLLRKIDKSKKSFNIEDADSLKRTLEVVHG